MQNNRFYIGLGGHFTLHRQSLSVHAEFNLASSSIHALLDTVIMSIYYINDIISIIVLITLLHFR